MGKSGSRRKKAGLSQVAGDKPNPNAIANDGIHLDSSVSLKRAHELKEEGNRRFQAKDYMGAFEHYDNALNLIPKAHPDCAVFHSNRAACLMQMKPVEYETVISECSMALQVQPRFVRALLRRARAYEAIGKYELAMQDVQVLLGADPNHKDALEITQRLRMALGPRQEAQQDLQSRPSPAALGASAVRGAPISGLGPCLPARPVPKKPSISSVGSLAPHNSRLEKPQTVVASENVSGPKTQMPKLALKPTNDSFKPCAETQKEKPSSSLVSFPAFRQTVKAATPWRPLKLVYGHDIRLARMPVNCSFREMREIVRKRLPSSKSVLVKFKDNDGDLITITCSEELKLAESYVDKSIPTKEPEGNNGAAIGMLRLHIVEVEPEQEPPIMEEEEVKPFENALTSSVGEFVLENEVETQKKEAPKDKPGALEGSELKEVEMDDWLFEFAQLFRSHVGIDPDAHIDLHELGMELCSEALEETVTSEEAQVLFDKAAFKFQEVAALALFNWGNVHMCAARKKIPVDESSAKEVIAAQLQVAYEWVIEKYSLAKEKYESALSIKPDFYEGLLALGQQQFEIAKLHWSYALAKKEDLSNWDPAETFKLFDSAEEKMKAATEMWEKLEEERGNEQNSQSSDKLEELLRKRRKQGGENDDAPIRRGEISADEAAEQATVMRSQIHLFWGNMLFERSQIECKLKLDGWKKNLDASVERFKLAGASEADISVVLKNHASNIGVGEGDEKRAETTVSTGVVKGGDEKDEAVGKAPPI